MIGDDPKEVEALARKIDELNARRREQTQDILESANRLIIEGPDLDDLYGIVVFDDGTLDCEWHHGVIGIVASKVVENYGRAAFLFAHDKASGKWKGSGRAPSTVGSVNLYDALSACSEHLYKFGGHAAAAGATLRAKNREELEAFAQAFNEAMKGQMRPEDRVPTLLADLEVNIDDLTQELWSMLRRFAPFGHGNEPVNMIARGCEVVDARAIGKEKNHLKLRLRHGGSTLDALGWGFIDRYPDAVNLGKGAKVDVFFKLDENTFRGQFQLQMMMDDLRIVDSGTSRVAPAAAQAAAAGGAGYHGPGAEGRLAPKNLFA
ncbi:MAG TPA: hypothetical protein ENO14_05580 [Chromatiales bacterium]|nr:hypothetical protein [Chromatiales bacterium]